MPPNPPPERLKANAESTAGNLDPLTTAGWPPGYQASGAPAVLALGSASCFAQSEDWLGSPPSYRFGSTRLSQSRTCLA